MTTMRNRKTIIAAFVLVACLLIGVGYAAVTGMLQVNATAKFNEFSETASDVHTAVKFKEAVAIENCTAAITDTTTNDIANMVATFTDTNSEVSGTYTAKAKYTIEYTSDVTTLPAATFSAPQVTETTANSKFVRKIYMADGVTEWTTQTVDLAVNSTYEFYVEISYTEVTGQAQVENYGFAITLDYTAQ